MSPKILEYQGITVKFFSDEHEPIHVHCIYGEYQTKVELYVKDKEIIDIKYKKVKGFESIPEKKMKDVKVLIEQFKYEIVADWINFFVYHSEVKVRKITQKLK
jgi:hypothetical protein